MMRQGSILINIARRIVDEDDLMEAVEEGRIFGTGLECYEEEPPTLQKYQKLWATGKALTLRTRPILLHLAKSKLEGNDADTSTAASSTLQMLAGTCIEAAGMNFDALLLLKQQELLVKFGYFDLHAAVSAAFIFNLSKAFNPVDHLGIDTCIPIVVASPVTAEGPTESTDHRYFSLDLGNGSYSVLSLDNMNNFNLDLGKDFMPTGADEINWEEFERQLTRSQ
ncbi:d-3-phosphoglycerate dehydrogenase [Stemphylium lycopersici]|nr:d-3-phosphoglycerate dehydrogenase [Stemphylium lycopersici]RAR09816.1 d-3-phosphoglycerate dehydrogenase [Stemphylium lycopersici]